MFLLICILTNEHLSKATDWFGEGKKALDNLNPHELCGILIERWEPFCGRALQVKGNLWYYPFHFTEIEVIEQKMLALYMGSSCKPQGKVVKVFCGMCRSRLENNQRKGKWSFQINALHAFNSFAKI